MIEKCKQVMAVIRKLYLIILFEILDHTLSHFKPFFAAHVPHVLPFCCTSLHFLPFSRIAVPHFLAFFAPGLQQCLLHSRTSASTINMTFKHEMWVRAYSKNLDYCSWCYRIPSIVQTQRIWGPFEEIFFLVGQQDRPFLSWFSCKAVKYNVVKYVVVKLWV